MSRPSQLLAIALVYLLGTVIARSMGVAFDQLAFLAGFLAVIPISASVHYANEYADHETDALTVRTPFSGGSGALPETRLPPLIALLAAWGALFIGAAVSVTAWYQGFLNPVALMVLAFGVFFGWMYSLPPLKLAWRGWGELTNAALGGVVLPAYAYSLQTGQVDVQILQASLPFGMLVFNNLLATTWPDRAADASVGKHTLATRWTTGHLRQLYYLVGVSAFLIIVLFTCIVFPPVVSRSSFLAAPMVVWGATTYTRKHSPFPTVAAMVLLLILQLAAWGWTIRY